VIRKRQFGAAEAVHLPQEAYSAEANHQVYQEMARTAATLLAAGQSVVADAVFGDPAESGAIRAAASGSGADFHGLWLEAPIDRLSDRVTGRIGDVSDATAEVMRRQIATFRRPDGWCAIDASGTPDAVAITARRLLGGPPMRSPVL
jgi:predicted kinase